MKFQKLTSGHFSEITIFSYMPSVVASRNRILRYWGEKTNVVRIQISVDLTPSCGNISMFDTETFLVEVVKKKCLWKISSTYYNNREMKLKTWDEIGEEMCGA